MYKNTNPNLSKKERNLIKGAIRRVFSRSEMRRRLIDATVIPGHYNSSRPRVKRWSLCKECKKIVPTYLINIDHIVPIVPLDGSFETMSLDTLVDRIWCEESNLKAICEDCHDVKTKAEMSQRAANKRAAKSLVIFVKNIDKKRKK